MLTSNPKPDGDFRRLLQQELILRCRKNPNYSLRAFARFLKIDCSRLSKILRGERPVRGDLLLRLGEQLGLTPGEIRTYAQGGHSPGETASRPYHEIGADTFEMIEDWRHYAILELMKVNGFRPEPKWLARMLKITVSETRALIERLERCGLLLIGKDGAWRDRTDGFSTHALSDMETSYARRRAQKNLLELAIEALNAVPMPRRDHSSIMMATHSSKLPEAKKRIRRFRMELSEFLENTETKDSVYQLSAALFPLVETPPVSKRMKP